MKLLALDTSTEACSVALAHDNTTIERFEVGQQHSGRVLLMVQDVLAEAGMTLTQLDAIAFGCGPGSFTGLRISAGVVQGLAFGANLPVVSISSLAALAQGVDAIKILTAFDARMNQVYWAAYVRNAQGLVELHGEEIVIAPDRVPALTETGWIGAGNGWDQYAGLLLERLQGQVINWRAQCFPRARAVAELAVNAYAKGMALAPEQALPVYVRDEVAVKQTKR
ncbi:MAG: tRNA (adenosine(37)-N6)-threonylcarbamoyltransferase complex dimerization subunit type 1 TsaB [Gammaproteobacteria bacterium]|nr:tRNA (adenosine(37)-N6)-threonylcarbamoyltransferase complex dimerization subunit type 1 TsaB [Gammaproteobacteria bacterium]